MRKRGIALGLFLGLAVASICFAAEKPTTRSQEDRDVRSRVSATEKVTVIENGNRSFVIVEEAGRGDPPLSSFGMGYVDVAPTSRMEECTDYPNKRASAQVKSCTLDCPGCLCTYCKVTSTPLPAL